MNAFGLLIFVTALVASQATDYCDRSLCQRGQHIACGNNRQIAPKCAANSEIVPMTAELKHLIVDRHNEFRNKIASGNLPGFQQAARMATIQWDDELASIAELNVKTCNFAHDSCRNTDAFRYAGQNLAYYSSYPAKTPREAIELGLQGWWDEYKYADQSVIDRFRSTGGPAIGHFTVMVADRNIRVGCATLKTVNGRQTQYTTACNYATTNMINFPLYKSGAAASGCQSGRNSQYPALCSPAEHYDVNKWF